MKSQEPKVSENLQSHHLDSQRHEHPAFGTVSLSRVSGQATLFDSEFKHQYFIALRINTAYMDRSLSRNWIHGSNQVAEVYMSEAQFATLVSSIGMGSGVPCTIQQIAKERMPGIIYTDTEQDKHFREFDRSLSEVYSRIDDLEQEINTSKITKKLHLSLSNKIRSIRSAAQSNLKFVAKSFAESMETTVEKAKMEILGYAQNNRVNPPLLENTETAQRIEPSDGSGDSNA